MVNVGESILLESIETPKLIEEIDVWLYEHADFGPAEKAHDITTPEGA